MSGKGITDYGNKKLFAEDSVLECLKVLESGEAEDLFELLPRISVVRDQRFYPLLLALLKHKDVRHREFAAYAMGAMADEAFLEPLKKAFFKNRQISDFDGLELQTAVIEAIGAIGNDDAVDFFLPELLKLRGATDGERTKKDEGMRRCIIGAIGAIAQQGRPRSQAALAELAANKDPEIQIMALVELSGAYWHRPNDISDEVLRNIYGLTASRNRAVAEAALAALQNLADVGCRRAEALFRTNQK
ncbi:MAG: HEAT repeat domain-containing protein [Acidobacteriota bacterium]|nr:HEAT repeat domain-containing protein [Acidobacteriota bacterium]